MLFIIFIILSLQSPNWIILQQLKVVPQFDPQSGMATDVPQFSPTIKSIEGKEIVLEGYMIPLDQAGGSQYFVLSRYPYANCFFCGQAGPETVVEIYTDKKVTFTEKKIRVKGTLKLNENDPLHLYYLLKNAEILP